MSIFLGQKKYSIWGDFSEKFKVLCKNPDEVTRFDGTLLTQFLSVSGILPTMARRTFIQKSIQGKSSAEI